MPRKRTSLKFDLAQDRLKAWKSQAPLVIAHRGASKYAPENTMSAFQAAWEMGADAIELDTQLSVDGKVMVFHDANLDRLTSGTGLLARQASKDLRVLDAGAHFSADFRGESIPFLGEVLEAFGQKLLINIELKNFVRPWSLLPDRVIELVRYYKLEHRILLSSFNPWALLRAKKLAPDIPVGLLATAVEPRWLRLFLRNALTYEAFHPNYALVEEEQVHFHHKHGRTVNVWTLDDIDQVMQMVAWGVDGIITSIPRETIERLRQGGLQRISVENGGSVVHENEKRGN